MEYRGRLSFTTFVKVCFIGVLGFTIITALVFFAFIAIAALMSSQRDWSANMDIEPSPGVLLFVLLLLAQVLASALLTGVAGYPLYCWIVRIRGGLIHTVYTCGGHVERDWKSFMRFVRASIRIVPIVAILSAVAAAVCLPFRTPLYGSSTLLLHTDQAVVTDLSEHQTTDDIDINQRLLMSVMIKQGAYSRLNISEDEVADKLRSIQVKQVGRSSLLNISVTSIEPGFSADLANAIADEYLEFKSTAPGTIQVIERAHPSSVALGPANATVVITATLIGIIAGFIMVLLRAAYQYRHTSTASVSEPRA